MLFVVDIGNTNIVAGIFRGENLECSWRISTDPGRTVDEYAVLFSQLFSWNKISPDRIESIVISSVVPPLNDVFLELCQKCFGQLPIFVDPAGQELLDIQYEPISDVGADRIVNALAALDLVTPPLIVVDFGTATTFDAVDRSSVYVGGVIAPGIGISAEALFQRASRLPRIEVHRPRSVIGRSTIESMQSGLYFGYIGLVDGVIARMRSELGSAQVIATGGLATFIASESQYIQRTEKNLTLMGLRKYYIEQHSK